MSALVGVLVAIVLVLLPVAPVAAQQDNTERIRELQQQLDQIRGELDTLRAQQQRQQQQLAAPPPPAEPERKLPLRIGGSLTFRYDDTEVEDPTDLLQDDNEIDGLRTRIRLWIDYNVDGAAGAGIRFTTGGRPNPTSPFIRLGDIFQSQSFDLDQYYIITRPVRFFEEVRRALEPIQELSLTFGKMPLPFWRGDRGTWRSEIVWDDDVSPAGMALQSRVPTGLSFLKIDGSVGYFVVSEVTDSRFAGLTDDTRLVAGQLKATVEPVSVAFAVYDYSNLNAGLRSPSFMPGSGAFLAPGTNALLLGSGLQATNNRLNFGPGANGFVEEDFTILNFTGQAYLPIPPRWVQPLRLDYLEPWVSGDWVKNTKVDQDDTGYGITFGLRGAPIDRRLGPFNIWFTYRDVDADATLATFTDSDLGAGTAYKGYEVGFNYKILPDLMLVFSYFNFDGFPQKNNEVRRWFLDLVFTF